MQLTGRFISAVRGIQEETLTPSPAFYIIIVLSALTFNLKGGRICRASRLPMPDCMNIGIRGGGGFHEARRQMSDQEAENWTIENVLDGWNPKIEQ